MACNITQGYALGCRDNQGGIKAVYIHNGSGSLSYTLDGISGDLTDIVGVGTFFKFDQVRQTSDYSQTATTSVENGTYFTEQTLNLQLHKLSGARQQQIDTLAKNPNTRIIIETNNGSNDAGVAGDGRYFLMGQHNGASLTAGNGTSGKAFGDLNGYTLTFTAQEPEMAKEIATDLSTISGSVNFDRI